jgi:hypothetical protein
LTVWSALLSDQRCRSRYFPEFAVKSDAQASRTVIEQAKGMIAAQRGVDMDRAFAWLRTQARSNNRLLTDVANEIIAGTLVVASSAGTQTTSKPPPRPR